MFKESTDAAPSAADQPFAEDIVRILYTHTDELVSRLDGFIAENPFSHAPGVDHGTAAQFIQAILAIVEEAVEGKPPEALGMLMGTVPASIRRGRSAQSVLFSSTGVGIEIARILAAELPERQRQPALKWFARFWAEVMGQLVGVATAAPASVPGQKDAV
jgi:hypothetical protein